MPTYSKIPLEVKAIGAIASGRFAVFCGLLKAGSVFTKLEKLDSEGKAFPMVGFITIKGEKIYYCRYGFVDDPDIYERPKNPSPQQIQELEDLRWQKTRAELSAKYKSFRERKFGNSNTKP